MPCVWPRCWGGKPKRMTCPPATAPRPGALPSDLLGAEQPAALERPLLRIAEDDRGLPRLPGRLLDLEGQRAVEVDRELARDSRGPARGFAHDGTEDRARGVELRRLQPLEDVLDGQVQLLDGVVGRVGQADERPSGLEELAERVGAFAAQAADVGGLGLVLGVAVAERLGLDRRDEQDVDPLLEAPRADVGVVQGRVLEPELLEDEPGPALVHARHPGLIEADPARREAVSCQGILAEADDDAATRRRNRRQDAVEHPPRLLVRRKREPPADAVGSAATVRGDRSRPRPPEARSRR